MFKMALDLTPSDRELCSQPTISRLENLPDARALLRMGRAMVDLSASPIPRFPSGSCWISTTRSMRFTAASDCACSMRITMNMAFNPSSCSMARAASSPRYCVPPGGQAERRSGPFCAACCAPFAPTGPGPYFGDSHYCAPRFSTSVAPTGSTISSASRRPRRCAGDIEGLEAATKTLYEAAPKDGKARRFKEFYDGATSWSRVEHVIARVEVGAQGPDTRFVVTNLQQRNARRLYKMYCRRGQAENHIKSWKTHLAADRTSCTKASANQLRLFLHAGAYWVMWGLRVSMPKRSMWRVAQFDTLRLRLIKIAARVVELKTMIRVHLPTSCPMQHIFHYALGQIPRLEVPRFVT